MAAKRGRRGAGTVFYDRARKRYVGQLSLGRDPQTGRRKRGPKVSAATEAECWDLLDEQRQELRKTATVAPWNTTVARVMADLMATPPAEWKSIVTREVNAHHAARITKALGSARLVKLTPGDVERFLHTLADRGYSTATIGATKGLLARAIRRAQRDGLVGRNVAELAEMPRGTQRKSKALTLGQVATLLGADLDTWWRAYLVTGITLGLRPGELLGLRWEDVDLAGGVVRVRKSLKQKRDRSTGHMLLVLDDLKTERSKRTLQMPRSVASVLKALRTEQAAARLRLGRHYTDHGLVFCSAEGKPCWRSTVYRGFRKRTEAAGIPGVWHPHEMRHTFVSVLSDAGVDIEDIADAAGHINSNVTRTVYRHVIADKITRAPAAMDEIFGQVRGS